jgi:hypothetical protein
MTLLFTGTIPGWMLALLFAAASAFTLWTYRSPKLQPPWNWLLPSSRILAISLLVLMLLQPVLGRVHETAVRGRIPVIIDTSGSMSIADRYDDSRKVDIAWNFEFFPRSLRSTAFINKKGAATDIGEHLHALSTQIDDEARNALRRNIEAAEQRISAFNEELSEAIAATDYLVQLREAEGPGNGRGLYFERFDGISGTSINSLVRHQKFTQPPDYHAILSTFDMPSNEGDEYGARIRGFIRPPESGAYIFSIASDDSSQLFLSSGPQPAERKRIAQVAEHVSRNRFDVHASQTSEEIRMERGKLYYVEVLYKEASGEDHLTVTWSGPGVELTNAPISERHLLPFVPNGSPTPFGAELTRLKTAAAASLKALQAARTIAQDDDAGTANRLKRVLTEATLNWGTVAAVLEPLQTEADRLLAGSGNPAVDAALKKIDGLSREAWIERLLNDEKLALLSRLQDKGEVDLFSFSEPVEVKDHAALRNEHATLPATRIGSVVHQVIAQYEDTPIACAVLLTDGNANSGKPLAELRRTLEERSIPLYAIGVGSALPPRDVVIERVAAPDTSFKDDSIKVSVVLQRPGYEARDVKVRLLREAEVVAEVIVPGDGDTRVVADMELQESEVGMRQYTVIAMPLENEVLNTNNSKEFAVNVLEDPVRVLFVDEFPRWESRYASLILQRDPRVKLDAVFVDVLSTQPPELRGTILPADRNELFAYDIVVMGDVDPHHFSGEHLRNLSDFVIERGGTLVTLAGEHHMPDAYRPTPLNRILPFRTTQLPGAASIDERGFANISLNVRDTFSQDALVQIGSTPEETQLLWQKLPGMIWAKSSIAPATAAEELVSTTPQNWPVMLTANPGSGKVLYLGSDSFWRWRYRAKWTYHQRLWGQILLWAIRGRTAGSDPYVKLMSDRPAYSPGEPITLKARVFDKEARPLANGTVAADIRTAAGTLVRTIPFVYLTDSGGEYRARIRDLDRGKYTVTPHVSELDDTAVTASWNFEVRDLPTSEYVNLSLNEIELRQMSDRYFSFHEAEALIAAIKPVEIRETSRADIEIWDTFWMLAMVAFLLGFEWQMRKRNKLV